jgi:nucleoside-diphosphate-sugar epimerase
MASEQDYEQVNVKATQRLAESAAAAGVQHFIYISSLNVVTPLATDPCAPPQALPEHEEPYARSKWLAESALQQICHGHDMTLTVIRPALMFDRELTANLATLERVLRWWPFLLPEKGRRCLVSRPDVVALILACVEGKAGAPAGQPVVAATDGECYSAQAISRLLGSPKVTDIGSAFVMPVWLCQWACRLLDWRRDLPQGSTWRGLAAEYWCGAAREVFGWQPSLTLKTRPRKD